jgi:hypothetical protein
MQQWEYLVVPLESAKRLKKGSDPLPSDALNELGAQGWEAVGLSLKQGDLVAWPVVLLKRPLGEEGASRCPRSRGRHPGEGRRRR